VYRSLPQLGLLGPVHSRHWHSGRQRSHQLRLPEDGRDLLAQDWSIWQIWTSRYCHQPHHLRRPIRTSPNRAGARNGNQADPQSHRQIPLRRRVPDRRGNPRGRLNPFHMPVKCSRISDKSSIFLFSAITLVNIPGRFFRIHRLYFFVSNFLSLPV